MRSLKYAICFSIALSSPLCFGQDAPRYFFADNFDQGIGTSSVGDTPWRWQAPYSQANEFGMMVGEGDIYEVSNAVIFRGEGSLRLNFDGRNGWCNQCGSDTYTVANDSGDVKFLKPDDPKALANQPNSDRPIFNKSDQWSRWTPQSALNDRLYFLGDSPTRNAMGGDGVFSAGDEVKVARECGLDGTVGGDPARRSDCNLAINYLEGLSASDFGYGDSLARRFYIYLDENVVMPNVAIKLGYTFFRNSEKGRYSTYAMIFTSRNNAIEVNTSSLTGNYTFSSMAFEKGTWYYFEEVFNRETSPGAADGTYQLYVYEHDQVSVGTPTVSLGGINFGELLEMSVIGNWQHFNDATGSMYIDEVAIADHYIGPVDGQIKIKAAPSAPILDVD